MPQSSLSFSPVQNFFKASLIAAPLALSGCAINQTSEVPGVNNEIRPSDPVPVTTVLTALKCQLAQAFVKINDIRANNTTNPLMQNFEFKRGAGVFSGKTQIVETGNGKITAVVPFTGVTGTNVTPSYAGTLVGTGIQEAVRTFMIDPKAEDADICQLPLLANVEGGTFIEDSLVALYTDTLATPLKRNDDGTAVPFTPLLINTELKLTSSFAVQQVSEKGFTTKILLLPSLVDEVDELGPSASRKMDKTGTYTLALTLPLLTASTPDTRRVHTCKGREDHFVCLEEAYTPELHKQRIDEIPPPVVTITPPSNSPFFNIPQSPGIFTPQYVPPGEIRQPAEKRIETDPYPAPF